MHDWYECVRQFVFLFHSTWMCARVHESHLCVSIIINGNVLCCVLIVALFIVLIIVGLLWLSHQEGHSFVHECGTYIISKSMVIAQTNWTLNTDDCELNQPFNRAIGKWRMKWSTIANMVIVNNRSIISISLSCFYVSMFHYCVCVHVYL